VSPASALLKGVRAIGRLPGVVYGAVVHPQEIHDTEVKIPVSYGPHALTSRGVGAFVDRALLTVMKRPSMYPDDDDHNRVRDEAEAARRLFDKWGWIDDPRSAHLTPPTLHHPAILHPWTRFERVEHLVFDSLFEVYKDDPSYARWNARPRNRTCHAWALRHPEPNRPWLVCVHGLGQGHPRIDLRAFEAARLCEQHGINLIFPVLPMHGARRDPQVPIGGLLSFELVDNIHGLRQAVWDVRRVISWVRQQGNAPVGIYGQSIGALVSSLVAATEPVDMAIAGIPVCDVPSLFRIHAPHEFREKVDEGSFLGDDVKALYRSICPVEITKSVDPATRFIFAGLADRVSTPSQAQLLYEAWEKPDIHWYDSGHVGAFWTPSVRRFIDNAIQTLVTP
jgi:hypothetical protein